MDCIEAVESMLAKLETSCMVRLPPTVSVLCLYFTCSTSENKMPFKGNGLAYRARTAEYLTSALTLTKVSSSTFRRNPNGVVRAKFDANFSMNMDFNVKLLYESTKSS